jgi:hypothetical protein
MYLTPERFRTMGFGVDLTNVDDVELRSALHRGRATIDAYCNVPRQPQPFDFRGGTITDEAHEWVLDPHETQPRPYRFWPWHQPVKAVSQLRIYSTPSVYTEIDADEIFINNSAGYIEISSLKLTQYGIFGAGVITTLVGLHHPVAKASYTYGWGFSVVGEYLEPTDAMVYRAQNQWWDSTITPEIKKNGVVESSGFTIDYDEGTVTFSSGLTASDVVTASYTYRLPHEISVANGLIAADELGESSLRRKGMVGVAQLSVGEITIRRTTPQGVPGGGTLVAETIPQEAQALLADFVFHTVR